MTGPRPELDGQAGPGAFEQMISAELRTPLEGVLALAELLERQPLAGDGAAYARTIAEHSRQLLRTLSDAADLSRAERGELALRPEPVRLRDVLDQVQADWMPQAVADGVGLGAFYEGDPALSVELDRNRLAQVFGTLIGEALRFTRRGGVEIGLRAVQYGTQVTLHGHVRDTGPKPSPEQLHTLFTPETPGAAEGGIRRSEIAHRVCRAVLDAMGGRIWAETNPGAGMIVRFTLETEASAALTSVDGPALGARVLIVDDNATNRRVAQTLVEMLGCSCETAEDGQDAVEAVRRGRFDAVLMDIRMPRMDGLEATRAIRALPGEAACLPVIALTANAGPDDVKAYLAAGMQAVVEKPIKAERLLAALTGALTGDAPVRTAAAA